MAVTALSVWFIPGVDDGVELLFQLVVLIASSDQALTKDDNGHPATDFS